ncbi:hypothetical protein IBG28_18150 [Marinomonas arctica]|uniref:DUF4238 domain-containing protein n=1 Tax=Marinomonas arctica TaxID=383750 RepID=A0A7H1J4Y8_9GAMM|nr:hypothetical protein [Marinomonas sp. BSi20414]QNT05554.1 hypothetical protein IBG28_18150 [Marinomonas arctica]GGN30266.1 hypothetical protein GCM10011350_23070 [Marinomonas arctica]
MTYERVRKGNPLQLTIDQHFHSAHAISKFYNNEDVVEIMNIGYGKISKKSKNGMLYTKRNWDERAEKGYMYQIESDFHQQIDNIKSYELRDHEAISRYLALWRLRHQFHIERLSDAPLCGIEGENYTKEEQERMESMGLGYVNEKAEIPARQLTGGQIQLGIDQLMQALHSIKWGVLKSNDAHFLCADCYHKLGFIPVSPTIALAANLPDQTLSDDEVAIINRQSVESASKFYFGSNLGKCPIAPN